MQIEYVVGDKEKPFAQVLSCGQSCWGKRLQGNMDGNQGLPTLLLLKSSGMFVPVSGLLLKCSFRFRFDF